MSQIQSVIDAIKKNSKVSVSLPFLRYELNFSQALDPATVDERIARLDHIKADLTAAAKAVAEMQREAQDNRKEAQNLWQSVKQLEQNKVTAETPLQVPV